MDPFLGEIRMFGGNFAPKYWAFCEGQVLPIAQNTALFSLLGTNYGGNGTQNYALPDLRGRVPMFWGQGPGLSLRSIGEASGSTTVALNSNTMPGHKHALSGGALGDFGTPVGPAPNNLPSGNGTTNIFAVSPTPPTGMGLTTPAGNSQPHNNMMPYQAVSFIIAMAGVYPPRS